MNFQQFLNEETRTANSAAVIKDVLDKVGMGVETVRQTQTKENTSTSTYKLNGHSVEAIWVMDDGPMKEEGYSLSDAEGKLKSLVDAFATNQGTVSNAGSIKNNETAVIKFEEFTINLVPFTINSAVDGSGSDKTYLRIDVK